MSDDVVYKMNYDGDYYCDGFLSSGYHETPSAGDLEVPRELAEAFEALYEQILSCPRVEVYDHPRRQSSGNNISNAGEFLAGYAEVIEDFLKHRRMY